MELIALFLLLALIMVFVLPLIALAKAAAARRETEDLTRRITLLELQIQEHPRPSLARARQAAAAQTLDEPRVANEAASAANDAGAASPPKPDPPAVRLPVSVPAGPIPSSISSAAPRPEPPPLVPAPAPVLPTPVSRVREKEEASPSATPFDWEQFMGVRLFAWLGGFALFLAAAFFVKYSFDHDLISPAMRVTMGFVIGLGLLAGGLRMSRERYKITADTLCATGTVILYAVTFASHAVYRFAFFGVIPTFLLMTLITVAAFLIAVRANALVVAVLGLLGGFLTPVLLGTGEDKPAALFTYIALLDIGLLAVASARRWDWLNLAGAAGTVLMLFGWAARFFTPEKVFVAMTVFLGFCALYLAAGVWARRKEQTNLWMTAATLLPPLATFIFTMGLITNPATGARAGVLFTFLFGADLVVLAMSALYANAAAPDRAGAATQPNLRWLGEAGGAIVFLLLALWTGVRVDASLLFWALGGYLGFAVLHTAFPLARHRLHAGGPSPVWTDGDEAAWLQPGWPPAEVRRQIPALSAILSYLLLVLLIVRVPLENPAPVFGVALLLTGMLLGLARLAGMTWLPAAGLGCAFLVEHAWHVDPFSGANPGLLLGWYLVFYAVFSLYPFLFHRGDGSKVVAWIASAASGPLHFWLIHDLVRRAWPNDIMGVVPALFALPALGGLFAILRQIPAGHPNRHTILAWFGGAALLFLTLIFPIQFERQWLTVGWALEGAALLWLFHRVPHPGLRYAGVALLVLAFVRLGLNPEVFRYQPRAETAILNWYLYTYGLVIAALFLGAKLLRPPHHEVFGKDARPWLVALGVLLAFLLMNIEIADYFTAPGEASLVFSFRGNFARDMTYTIGWALFAFGLLVAGIMHRLPPARWAGIGLLGLTLLKLFFHDLATLSQLYRVGALVGVALVAIVASFLYQKFLAAAAADNPPPPDPVAPADRR